MELFGKVDYFKKVSSKHKRPTLCGGILSVISVGLICGLFVSEVINYWVNPRVLKKAEISNEYESFSFVELGLDIVF